MTKLNYSARNQAILEITGKPPRESLIAKKVKTTTVAMFFKTEFYSLEGILFHTVPAYKPQPSRGKRSIEINGVWYNLRWAD